MDKIYRKMKSIPSFPISHPNYLFILIAQKECCFSLLDEFWYFIAIAGKRGKPDSKKRKKVQRKSIPLVPRNPFQLYILLDFWWLG
jgi:hypothetical protein